MHHKKTPPQSVLKPEKPFLGMTRPTCLSNRWSLFGEPVEVFFVNLFDSNIWVLNVQDLDL